MDWIGSILENIREMECPCCGARLATCAVRGITAEPDALVVRLACSICNESSIAVVRRDAFAATAITLDDVIDAHEVLNEWRGSMAELFRTSKAARS
ncbi:MAG TPA: hypothetical protein VJQ09_08455 [Candidatus Limnocylindria bacterium]|nr:hypothetical protein [Candidatus Limnocylindria bacterium]